jgi:putative oxidoreductase
MNLEEQLWWRIGSQAFSLLAKIGNAAGVVLLLFFRLNWGWQFFKTGMGKLRDPESVAQFFATLHIPAPEFTAHFVGTVECVGGILLLLGLAARPVGLILFVNMTVAYLSVPSERQKVFNFFSDQDAFLQADPFFFLLTAALAFCFGAGPFSVDRLIAGRLKHSSSS